MMYTDIRFFAALACVSMAAAHGFSETFSEEEIRSIVEDAVHTEYCGTAMLDGLSPVMALRGEAPLAEHGFVRLAEEDWRPVLLEWAKRELEERMVEAREKEDIVLGLRQELSSCAERYGPKEERARLSNAQVEAIRALDETTRTLRQMIPFLAAAQGGGDEIEDFLVRIIRDYPRESSVHIASIRAWLQRVLRQEDASRCLSFGQWLQSTWGHESPEHWNFCLELVLSRDLCGSRAGKALLSGYLLESLEQADGYAFCNNLSMSMEDKWPEWKGSLQRRRLAERFKEEPARGAFLRWNEEKREYERSKPTEQDIAWMMWSRAAAELAADESELTDLREVYGDWAKEDARD